MNAFKSMAFIIVGLFWATVSHSAIISSYDFKYNLEDTLGIGLILEAFDGTLGANRYSFSNNEGLGLSLGLRSPETYAIEMRLQIFDDVAGYNKLIDFQQLNTDQGLYIKNGGVKFHGIGGAISDGVGVVLPDTDFTVGIERAEGIFSIYLDNQLLQSSPDQNYAVSSQGVLNFFIDDITVNQAESFAGSVDFIRIHDDATTFGIDPLASNPSQGPTPVPLPPGLWLLMAGLMSLSGIRRMTAQASR